ARDEPASRADRHGDRGAVRPRAAAGRAPRRAGLRAIDRPGVAHAAERRRVSRSFWPPIVTAILVGAAWHVLVAATGIAPYLLPAPASVAREAWAHAGELGAATLRTALAASVALVGAVAGGLAVGFVFAQSRTVARSLYPYAIFLQTV